MNLLSDFWSELPPRQTREFEDHIEDREAPTVFTWVNQNAILPNLNIVPFRKIWKKNEVKQVGSDPSTHP